ncbi:hypothetical protein F0251_02350 [Vibrio sp. 070316B]|uniref:hypothetical protein n=1 Tax=Vibrio sp. 070316B TaxID=2607608 RepID=UPI001493BCA6|nr:hypothetical protein [Vibrio sp. 070316B]NOI37278.1 hypothetical protein [Vibrio sp. 070316B]
MRRQYNFRKELTQSLKIKDTITFITTLRKKLSNPIFQASLLFSKSKFLKTPFGGDESMLPDGDFDHVLAIILIKLQKEKKLLAFFNTLKSQYEHQVLKGQFEEALDTIETVKDISGLSCWFVECKFALLASLERYDEFENFYNMLTKNIKSDLEKRDIDLIFERTSPNSIAERVEFSLDSLKEGLVQEKAYDAHIVDFLHRFDASKQYDAETILSYFWQSNIVDIYNIISRLLFSNSINNNSILKLKNMFIDLAESTNSLKLKNFFYHDFEIDLDKNIKTEFVTICDTYITGDYKYCISLCEDFLKDHPYAASIYEFYCNSLFNENWVSVLDNKGLLKEIIELNLDYNNINEAKINKIFLRFNNLDSIQFISLRNNKKIISFSEEKLKSIENIYHFFECTVVPSNPFNPKLEIKNSISSTITSNSEEYLNEIPEYRKRKRLADKYFHERQFSLAIETYMGINNTPNHMINEISNKIILSYFSNNQVDLACKYISDMYFSGNLSIERLDKKQIIDILEDCDPVDEPMVEIPISLFLLTTKKDSHIVALHLDDYLDFKGLKKPSDIKTSDEKHKFMLHKVCNLDVLESLHIIRKIYPTSNDRMLDRTLILSKLKNELSYKEEEISKELEFLQHQFSRNLCVSDVAPGKININNEMIAQIFKSEKKNVISNLQIAYSNEKNSFEFEFSKISSQINTNLFVSAYEFFMAIRDIYTLDQKYGLDYQLNTNIRHNGIVPSLRSIFESEGIICDHENNQYKDNIIFETECRSLLVRYKYEELQNKIKIFSKNVDTRLNKLKSVYMHVATNDKDDKEKLFKIIIDESDVFKLLVFMNDNNNINSCISYCLGIMTAKSEGCLKLGRALIKMGLGELFKKELKNLETSLKGTFSKKFIDAISITRNDLDSRLESISEWLNFSEYSADDFLIEVALYEANSFIETIFCNVNVEIEINNTFNKKINGKYLMSFINIFILIFENACKRRKHKDHIKIVITTSIIGETINIEISNKSSTIDKEIINKINSDINDVNKLDNANKEINSGIYKVKKHLEIDISAQNNIYIQSSGDEFIFNIDIDTLSICSGS